MEVPLRNFSEPDGDMNTSPMLDWIIYYSDGTIFCNLDGEPDQAPPMGVQAIACVDGLWLGGDFVGLIDYLSRRGRKIVRFGTHIPNHRFSPIVEKARITKLVPPDRTILERYDYYWWEGDAL